MEENNQVMQNNAQENAYVNNVATANNYATTQADVTVSQAPSTPVVEDKIVVKVDLLKDALRKADVIASKIDTAPMTLAAQLVIEGNILKVIATDMNNSITVSVPVESGRDGLSFTFRIVDIKPLIDKLPGETLIIARSGNNIKITADSGEYLFNEYVDNTDGKPIIIPNLEEVAPISNIVEVDKTKLLAAFKTVSPLIEQVSFNAEYSTIYVGDIVATTNGADVSVVRDEFTSILGREAHLRLSTVKALLTIGTGDKINIGFGTLPNGLVSVCFLTDNYKIYSALKENSEEFPIETIKAFMTMQTSAKTVVNRKVLINSIGRLQLFFGSGVIRQALDFEITPNQLKISNENRAFEIIPVVSNANIKLKFDIKKLDIPLKAITTDEIIIEPLITNEAEAEEISMVRISGTDGVSYVIGVALY